MMVWVSERCVSAGVTLEDWSGRMCGDVSVVNVTRWPD